MRAVLPNGHSIEGIHFRRDLLDRAHEAIVPPGDCLDIRVGSILFEYLTQDGNILRQVYFFDKGVRPYFFEQVFFIDDASATLHQRQECVKAFWRKRHNQTVSEQDTLAGVE